MDYKYINIEYLESVSGGDNSIIIEIVALFREQAEEFYKEMTSRLAAKDYHSLSLLAHKAKSSVAIMGMNDLAVMLKTFELQAREEIETDKYESYIARFKDDTDNALKELDNLINNSLNKD